VTSLHQTPPHPRETAGARRSTLGGQALRFTVVLAVGELALTRFSGGHPVAAIHICFGLGGLVTLGVGPALAMAHLGRSGRGAARLHAAWALALCALIGTGILGPSVVAAAGWPWLVGSGVGLLALMAALTRLVGGAAPAPYPRPVAVVAYLALVAGAAWWLGPGTLPERSVWAPLAATGVVLSLLPTSGLRVALTALLGVGLARTPVQPPQIEWADRAPAAGPDLVLISIDTLRRDAAQTMRSYDRLASSGLEFEAAQSPAPWTLPAVASLMTGVPPSVHGAGVRAPGHYTGIDPTTPTLAETLARHGYDTAAVLAPNPFVGAGYGFDRGFDHVHQPGWSPHALPRGLDNQSAAPVLGRVAQRLLGTVLDRSHDGAMLTDHALEVLAQRRDRPLFLWVHYLDTHLPYSHTTSPAVTTSARAVVTGKFHQELRRLDRSPALRDALWAAYMDEVRFVDQQTGRLLDALEAAPGRSRVVVLTADHGEEFFEHGGFEHGHSLFGELVDVPLVISGLGAVAGPVAAPVALSDVGATLLAAAGRPAPARTGVNLAGLVPPGRALRSGNLLRGAPDRLFAVRRGRWKAIAEQGAAGALYDLEADPGERDDRLAEHPDLHAELTQGQPWSDLGRGAPSEGSPTQRAMLEELGYTAPPD